MQKKDLYFSTERELLSLSIYYNYLNHLAMGFISDYKNIGKINTLLKQIEPKVATIFSEVQSFPPDKEKMRDAAGNISVLMSEIMEIANSSGRSVQLTHYYFLGKKSDLVQISNLLAGIVERYL